MVWCSGFTKPFGHLMSCFLPLGTCFGPFVHLALVVAQIIGDFVFRRFNLVFLIIYFCFLKLFLMASLHVVNKVGCGSVIGKADSWSAELAENFKTSEASLLSP